MNDSIRLAVGQDRYVPVNRKIIGFRNAMMTLLGRSYIYVLRPELVVRGSTGTPLAEGDDLAVSGAAGV